MRIAQLAGRRVWDSRGLPALEVEVMLEGGAVGVGSAPAAGLPAPGEPFDLRDGGAAFAGQDLRRAIESIRSAIGPALIGLDAADQEAIDRRMIALDGTPERRVLGGNAMLAVSLAVAKASAAADDIPLWQRLAGGGRPSPLPLPRVQLLDCGLATGPGSELAGVWLVPFGAEDFGGALDWCSEVTRTAAGLVAERGRGAASSGPRGGLRLAGVTAEEAIEVAVRSIERAGFAIGEDVALGLDVRAWRFGRAGRYRIGSDGRETDTHGMISRYLGWLRRYPIVSIADPLGNDEIAGLAALTAAAGAAVEIALGDSVLADPRRVRQLAGETAGTALIVKAGQSATLTEMRGAVDEARSVGWRAIVAARTGETEAGWLVHLAVAWGIGQLAIGGLARGERVGGWNEGLRLADRLPTGGAVPPNSAFPW